MVVRKFHSLSEATQAKRLQPGTAEFSQALRSVFWMANKFAPHRQLPPGIHKFRSIEEAQASKKSWERPPRPSRCACDPPRPSN